MKTVALIPAGGSGRRLQTGVAKQYLILEGLPVLVRSLRVFEQAPVVDEVIVVVPQADIEFVRKELVKHYNLRKVAEVLAGGAERQDSVRNGLAIIDDTCGIVLVHDGVRPFVTVDMINDVVAAARNDQAAAIGVAVKDTVKETREDGFVTKTVPRSSLWLAQTPQAFKCNILQDAYRSAQKDNYHGTDDASLVERIGIKVKMIAGSYENLKITTPEDLIIAEALLKSKSGGGMRVRTGYGYDSHQFAAGRKLILGGVEIPFEKGLDGHSDADALIHAVCDALLGAAAAGDIGGHFPDTDSSYKDISSLLLLGRVREIVAAKGFAISNVDVTIITERPKMASYAARIAKNLADVLHLSTDEINIKAKTNEGMGFIGRGEGIAVMAVVALK